MWKRRSNSEFFIGVLAIIVSLFTLFVFSYQTSLIRKQQYMSVYPHLDLGNINTGSLEYRFVLRNDGIGPAFIRDIEIKEKNGREYGSLVEYVDAKRTPEDSIYYYYSDLFVGRLIRPDETIELFGLSDNDYTENHGAPVNTLQSADRLKSILNHDSLDVTITYESIYEESWSLKKGNPIPTKN